jgi:type I restriction enzyme, S subunit
MNRVEQMRLGQFAEVFSGYAFRSQDFKKEGIPAIKISNIKNGYVDLTDDSTQYLDSAFLRAIPKKFITKKGDILISLTGSHLTQPNSVVGRVARYKYDTESLLNQRAGKVIIKDRTRTDARYLFYLLSTDTLRQEIALLAHGAANQANVSPKDIEKIKIFLPPLSIQRQVSAVLSAHDDLIENNNRRIAILEKMAEETYREWFVRMRFPGHEKVKIHKGVPEGWRSTQIDTICTEVRRGIKVRDLDQKTKYLGLEHLPRKSISITEYDLAGSVQSDKLLFQAGDILFGKIRPYLHKVVLAHFNGACSSDTIVIRPKSPEYCAFVLFLMFSETFVELATVSSKGTKMPRADWDFLKKLTVIEPTKDLLLLFQSRFASIFSMMCNLTFANERMQASRDLLLSRLITGKLSVEDLDIQFPASMKAEEADA